MCLFCICNEVNKNKVKHRCHGIINLKRLHRLTLLEVIQQKSLFLTAKGYLSRITFNALTKSKSATLT